MRLVLLELVIFLNILSLSLGFSEQLTSINPRVAKYQLTKECLQHARKNVCGGMNASVYLASLKSCIYITSNETLTWVQGGKACAACGARLLWIKPDENLQPLHKVFKSQNANGMFWTGTVVKSASGNLFAMGGGLGQHQSTSLSGTWLPKYVKGGKTLTLSYSNEGISFGQANPQSKQQGSICETKTCSNSNLAGLGSKYKIPTSLKSLTFSEETLTLICKNEFDEDRHTSGMLKCGWNGQWTEVWSNCQSSMADNIWLLKNNGTWEPIVEQKPEENIESTGLIVGIVIVCVLIVLVLVLFIVCGVHDHNAKNRCQLKSAAESFKLGQHHAPNTEELFCDTNLPTMTQEPGANKDMGTSGFVSVFEDTPIPIDTESIVAKPSTNSRSARHSNKSKSAGNSTKSKSAGNSTKSKSAGNSTKSKSAGNSTKSKSARNSTKSRSAQDPPKSRSAQDSPKSQSRASDGESMVTCISK